ncbi:DNA-processing protein DprA [Marinicella gelatinilytica]|uniref:DNA-processing protein DprA n=1 Tax=Marinicella gelatinilytica TaxID=2996017 RepID=UPI002260F84D|nr:DNA-processing protein DprA [Marinicella gelatinilytica]MCX7545721.1 DNA-processing protein DprA [Marinicella gelatinilytica]
MGSENLQAWLHVYRAPGLGFSGVSRLLDYYGDITAIPGRTKFPSDLKIPVTAQAYLKDCRDEDLTADLKWLEKPQNHILPIDDDLYPPQLKATADPPLLLFIKGHIETLLLPQLAVVGSRRATRGGLDNAQSFCYELAKKNWVITSGLAAGVDAASHQAALDAGGQTVAVMGTGINTIYPKANQQLAKDIMNNGAIVSEFDFNTPPQANNFPRRNRIIAGLSLGTLVVESGKKSGTLITARLTYDINRPVMAIPGSIHNPMAKGCHWLIKQGAALVESVDDIVHELTPGMSMLSEQIRERMAKDNDAVVEKNKKHHDIALSESQQQLLAYMGYDPISFDALVAATEQPSADISADLLILELNGLIEKQAGAKYLKR